MTRVIGLIGAAGSGKSLAAEHLQNNYSAVVRALADPLKEIVGRAFSLTGDQLYGTQEQKETIDSRYNVSPRWLMQRIGTQGVRYAFGEDIWVETLLKRAKHDKLTAVSDVRFVNEAHLLKLEEAVLVRLVNTNRVSNADPKHQSEVEWSLCEYDYEIVHDGKTPDSLLTPLDQICYTEGITPTRII